VKQHPAVDALRKASKGLVFVSETDSNLKPFLWKNGAALDDARVVELSGAEPGTPVETMSLEDFFRAVPSTSKAKFQQLAGVIQEQLSGVKVYKVGEEAEREAYIVGKTKDGQWAGLRTTVVET
jgi:hypothetical protein